MSGRHYHAVPTKCATGKTRYRDRLAAELAIARIDNRSQRDTVPVRTYPCQFCNGWHTTSQGRRRA